MVDADALGPALPLTDNPSIAVLPFANLSGDPEQEYFADGMVEEIITALSRIRWLFVIARNSSFTYEGRAVDVKEWDKTSTCDTSSKDQCARGAAGTDFCAANRGRQWSASLGRPVRRLTRGRI